jgi:hypothetical protein
LSPIFAIFQHAARKYNEISSSSHGIQQVAAPRPVEFRDKERFPTRTSVLLPCSPQSVCKMGLSAYKLLEKRPFVCKTGLSAYKPFKNPPLVCKSARFAYKAAKSNGSPPLKRSRRALFS